MLICRREAGRVEYRCWDVSAQRLLTTRHASCRSARTVHQFRPDAITRHDAQPQQLRGLGYYRWTRRGWTLVKWTLRLRGERLTNAVYECIQSLPRSLVSE